MPIISKPICDECGRMASNGRYIRKESIWYRIEHTDRPGERLPVQISPEKQVFCTPECALKPISRALVDAWSQEKRGGVRVDLDDEDSRAG